MDFGWVAIALGDVAWIALAFALGFMSRSMGLPPLVGYLAAGFFLGSQGIANDALFQKLADLGITLLLFTVGLKLSLSTLARPQVWAVSGIHASVVIGTFCLGGFGLAFAGVPFVSGLDLPRILLVAFALSFSSTVFVVKALEERGEMTSLHGRIAIGILIMQDIAAVIFLAVSAGKWPSPWAFSLFMLVPLRPLLYRLLERVGHGELMVLYGFLLALGGAEVFELVGMKGDLGALVLGILIGTHPKSEELSRIILGYKDLFLLGFFLSIGLSAKPTWETLIVGSMITPLVFFKSAVLFALLARFKLRARTSLLATLSLTNYSEFGLIVAAVAVEKGWLEGDWLVVIAIAVSLSFVIAAGLNTIAYRIYSRHRTFWRRWQREPRLPDDRLLDVGGATIAIVGMGRVGIGAYDKMHSQHGRTVVGVDIDPITVRDQQGTGRNVLLGDPSDADFWDRVQASHQLELIMLALPKANTSLAVLDRLRETSFTGRVAATARFPDEEALLEQAGAITVFNLYSEAGAGFAAHVDAQIPQTSGRE